MPRKKRHQRVKVEADPPSPGSLPSRSEVKRRKNKKKKIRKKKSGFPLIKILAAFFIFVPLAVILFMDIIEKKTLPLIKEISNGYETVSVVPHSTEPLKEDHEVSEQTTVVSDAGKDGRTEEQKTVADKTDGITQRYHVVVPGDTLFTIAITYYHSSEGMDIIRDWNKLDSDEVQLGQKLKVPVKE
ncbi:LysM peptidoglycan-binding domain-containing protein [Peribacillus sp. FSL H8-0477]|uniref:LysM peptidoglycan-binding domain-containing protein n=1 Tax=Peribacillus sp. FSL H8-0477 TaxID=2921388 RepID=UPI0030F597E3